MDVSFSQATRQRRSIRALLAQSPIPDTKILQLVEETILHVPSAFNSQATRMTVLLHNEHRKHWSIAADVLQAHVGDERWEGGIKDRMTAFRNAYGTVLFWDDEDAVKALREGTPDIYQDKLLDWAHQSNGMHQYHLWTALSACGLGVNLQHYNPLIDERVKAAWKIPEPWQLRAQMVFGQPKDDAEVPEKEQKVPVAERVLRFGVGEGNGDWKL